MSNVLSEYALDINTISKIAMKKKFRDNVGPINSVDFSQDGEYVLTSSDDESMHLYSAVTGKSKSKVYSKKYGVDLVRFARSKVRVICASKNGWDESLRYLSLLDNQYLRYFKGHRDRVVSLSVSPEDDTFLSASYDHTIRLWDLRSSACQGLITRAEKTAVSYDPAGLIFAVLSATNTISLYDKRNFDVGPFKQWQIDMPPMEWKSIEFSHDGNYVLTLSEQGNALLVDVFNGTLLQEYKLKDTDTINTICFTTNGQYVQGGCISGKLVLWMTQTGKEIATWEGHEGPVSALKWNPKYMMVVSADTNLSFWTP